MVHEWKNKVVLITGGANGVGEQLVRILMHEGVKHIAFLDVAETQGLALEKELNTKLGKNLIRFIKCDVGDEKQYAAAFQAVVDQLGYIDVLVNNAGVFNDRVNMVNKVVDVNYTAIVTSSHRAMAMMRQDHGGKGGTIINVSSIAAFLFVPMSPNYSGTKAAVLKFGTCIGHEDLYKRTKVRVMTICFGGTKTNMLETKNMQSYDQELEKTMGDVTAQFYHQKPESAAQGIVDAFKQGESASIWVVTMDKPAKDITEAVKKAHEDIAKQFAY